MWVTWLFPTLSVWTFHGNQNIFALLPEVSLSPHLSYSVTFNNCSTSSEKRSNVCFLHPSRPSLKGASSREASLMSQARRGCLWLRSITLSAQCLRRGSLHTCLDHLVGQETRGGRGTGPCSPRYPSTGFSTSCPGAPSAALWLWGRDMNGGPSQVALPTRPLTGRRNPQGRRPRSAEPAERPESRPTDGAARGTAASHPPEEWRF